MYKDTYGQLIGYIDQTNFGFRTWICRQWLTVLSDIQEFGRKLLFDRDRYYRYGGKQ